VRPAATNGPEIVCRRYDGSTTSDFDAVRDLRARVAALVHGKHEGIDNLTGLSTEFAVRDAGFRENLIAAGTGSIARHRSLVCALSMALAGSGSLFLPAINAILNARAWRLYIAEKKTPLYEALARNARPNLVVGSEYLGEGFVSGDVVDGVRHEDLQQLSFPDASFDLVLTTEVLEHIPDAERAEREIVRVLRPGGYYLFTVPLDPYGDDDTILAERLPDGSLRFHGEPVYHGDPLRAEGILAYRIFALAALERRFRGLGCTFETYRFWSPELGMLGTNLFVHFVRKHGA
jgi:SAM-dependent methyltransferase